MRSARRSAAQAPVTVQAHTKSVRGSPKSGRPLWPRIYVRATRTTPPVTSTRTGGWRRVGTPPSVTLLRSVHSRCSNSGTQLQTWTYDSAAAVVCLRRPVREMPSTAFSSGASSDSNLDAQFAWSSIHRLPYLRTDGLGTCSSGQTEVVSHPCPRRGGSASCRRTVPQSISHEVMSARNRRPLGPRFDLLLPSILEPEQGAAVAFIVTPISPAATPRRANCSRMRRVGDWGTRVQDSRSPLSEPGDHRAVREVVRSRSSSPRRAASIAGTACCGPACRRRGRTRGDRGGARWPGQRR